MTQVHGHKVLNILAETPMTITDLSAELATQFGTDVRFHTCSQQDLELAALMDFFIAKQKVILNGEKLTINPERVCNH